MLERRGRSEAQFLTVPVQHKITDINPEFQEQLGLAVGDESPLVRIFTTNQTGEGLLLGAEPKHKRIGNVDNTFVIDKNGFRWEDIDTKSPGLVETIGGMIGMPLVVKSWDRKPETSRLSSAVWGHNDLKSSQTSFKYQKVLEDLGIRTYKSLFVAKLGQIFYKGKVVPISEVPVVPTETRVMEDNDALPAGFEPATEVRACRTKTRMQLAIDSAHTAAGQERIVREVTRARELIAEEFNLEQFSVGDYLHWFIENYARNVGVLHAAGFTHGFLNPGNTTLDCRMLDLDSMTTFLESYEADREASEKEYGISLTEQKSKETHVIRDTRVHGLISFVQSVCSAHDIPIITSVADEFMKAYEKAQERFPAEVRTVELMQLGVREK